MNKISVFYSLLLCCCFCFFGNSLKAQEETATEGVYLTARVIDGYVELRWSPTNTALWRHANQEGYVLERMELGTDQWEALTTSPIQPFTREEWATRTNQEEDYVIAASRAILEPPAPPRGNADFEEWDRYQNEENGVFFFFLAAANLNAEASLGAGLRYEDKTIEIGKSYVYRISIPAWKGPENVTNFAIVEDTEQKYEAPEVIGVRAVGQESAVSLYWPASNKELFPAFHVERSLDGRTYQRLNRLPLMFSSRAEELSFKDSVGNYQSYYYRVVGATPFGDEGRPSTAVRVQARDLTPPPPVVNARAQGDRRAVEVQWSLTEKTADLAGFLVGRSGNVNGPFQMLTEQPLSAIARKFTDATPMAFEPYYVVYSVDTANNVNPAFAVLATIADGDAPVSPLELQGNCDTNGIVTLNWVANREEDLLGYHIYTANSEKDVYLPITQRPIKLTEWQDTVNMRALNRSVFYKLTAVDYNNNPSDYSKVLEVKRPDIIAPAAPMIHNFSLTEKAIELEWYLSSSDDIARYQLTRQQQGDPSVSIVLTFTSQTAQKNYRDEDLVDHQTYSYQLTAIDEAGHQTASDLLTVSTGQVTQRTAVNGWKASFDERQQTARLEWQTLANADDTPRYVMYRAVPGKALRSYRSFAADENAFEDYLPLTGVYRYALKVIWPDGSESPMSEILDVQY